VDAARAALAEAERLESLLTVFQPTSAIVRLNEVAADRPVGTDREVFALLQHCRRLSQATGGAFDITATALGGCWGFLQRAGRLRGDEEIEAARRLVGMEAVVLEGNAGEASSDCRVRFARPGVELNLGAIGKGYALDRMRRVLAGHGVTRA